MSGAGAGLKGLLERWRRRSGVPWVGTLQYAPFRGLVVTRGLASDAQACVGPTER